MNYYETLYIVHPALESGRLKDIILNIEENLKKIGGNLLSTEVWGKKKLAYFIEKQKYGSYVLIQYTGKGNCINELSVELENVTGNGTTGQNGEFSINTTAPTENHYDGYTISAMISGNLDATEPGFAVRVFRVDATAAGLQTHAPLGVRVIPDSSQLFNVSIADTIGLDDSTLNLRWWAESIHDDGDGIPQAGEYATSPLLRQSGTDYFHAIFDDSSIIFTRD